MPNKKEKRIHEIIKQARRPVCMALVLAIVFIYGSVANAYTGDVWTFRDYYNVPSASVTPPKLTISDMCFDYDYNKLNFNSHFFNINDSNSTFQTRYQYFTNIIYNGVFEFPAVFEYNNTSYDVKNCLHFGNPMHDPVRSYQFYWDCVFSPTDDYICFVNNFLISNSPFSVLRLQYRSDGSDWSAIGMLNATMGNSFYYIDMAYNLSTSFEDCTFCDLDIFFSSSDSSSGFSGFNDFSVSNVSNYHNFNIFKTQNYISPGGSTPDTPSQEEIDAHHYLNFNCQSFYSGSDSRYVFLNLNMSWNENMIQHPEFYTIHVLPYVKLKLDADSVGELYAYNGPDVIPYDYEEINLLELRNTVGYLPSVLTKKYDLKRFVSGQNNAYDKYLEGVEDWGGLFAVQEVEGDSNIDIVKNGLLGTLAQLLTGSSTPTTYVKVRNDLSAYFDYYEIWARVWITSDAEQYSSGVNESHYDFLSGTSITDSTNNNINNYPPDTGSGQSPSVISQTGQLPATTGSGSVNNGFNGVFSVVSEMNANIEYLYNLDVSDFNNIAGNSTSALQSAVNFVTSSDQQHGFGAILTRSYGMIPEDIQDWIKTTVGVLLGGAILGWVYSGIRIKRG